MTLLADGLFCFSAHSCRSYWVFAVSFPSFIGPFLLGRQLATLYKWIWSPLAIRFSCWAGGAFASPSAPHLTSAYPLFCLFLFTFPDFSGPSLLSFSSRPLDFSSCPAVSSSLLLSHNQRLLLGCLHFHHLCWISFIFSQFTPCIPSVASAYPSSIAIWPFP